LRAVEKISEPNSTSPAFSVKNHIFTALTYVSLSNSSLEAR